MSLTQKEISVKAFILKGRISNMYRSKQILSQLSIYALILCLIASTGWAGYKRINEPNPDDPMAVEIYQLDNGLTVYLTENP